MACLATAGLANATTIDFESVAVGAYSSLHVGDVTITFEAGNNMFDVTSITPNDGVVDGKALLSYFQNNNVSGPYKALFDFGVSSVSINMSDFIPSDEDFGILSAYDAGGNFLTQATLAVGGNSIGGTLLVSSGTPIAYVLFEETGSFPGAVYWDKLSYEAAAPIPEPATGLILGAGLTLLRARRRR